MRIPLIAATAAALSACALVGRGAPLLPPLEDEGEVVVELQPPQLGKGWPALGLTSLAAVRADGTQHPLAVLLPRLDAGEAARQRMLARGRLPAGEYAGLAVAIAAGEKPAPPPERVEAPFAVARRHATVLELSFRDAPSLEAGALPALAASVPPRPLPQVAAYCTDAAAHDVLVVDKLTRRVSELIPTGRGPWGVALDPVQNRAYVALEGEDQIAVVDVATGEELSRIRLSLGDAPRELALTPDRRTLLSANAGSNSVSFIDPAAMIELSRAAVGQEPTSLLIDRKGLRAYVTNLRSSSISVLDLGTRSVAGTLATEDRPLRPQLDRAGSNLYVLQPNSAFLGVYALPGLAPVKRIYVGLGNSALKVDPATDLIYVAKASEARLSVYDPFSAMPVAAVEGLEGVTWMAIDDAENALFALSPARREAGVIALAHKRLVSVIDTGPSPRVLAVMGERN